MNGGFMLDGWRADWEFYGCLLLKSEMGVLEYEFIIGRKFTPHGAFN